MAKRLSKEKERYLAARQELNPRSTQVESSHKPLFCDIPLLLKRSPQRLVRWYSANKCHSSSAFHYSIASSIPLRIVPSVGVRTQSTWRWNAPCMSNALSAIAGALGVSFHTTHVAL